MYKCTAEAYVCIVHLAETRALRDMDRDAWFTRGWTLQELLAPRDVRFYNMDWRTCSCAAPRTSEQDPAVIKTMIEEKNRMGHYHHTR